MIVSRGSLKVSCEKLISIPERNLLFGQKRGPRLSRIMINVNDQKLASWTSNNECWMILNGSQGRHCTWQYQSVSREGV